MSETHIKYVYKIIKTLNTKFEIICGPIHFNIHTHTYIYIYIYIFGPVKPELGVIPSGQEGIQAWIFKIFLVKSSMYQ